MIQTTKKITTPMNRFDSNDLLLSVSLIDCPIFTAVV